MRTPVRPKTPDWEGACATLLERLARELPPNLAYHGLRHTRDDVLPATERLASKAGLDEEETLLLKTAALYHDAGFLFRYADNEELAAELAGQTLPGFGYTPAQVETVQAMILATRMPQRPQKCLQALLCDADLDALGREDFLQTSEALRVELEAHGISFPVREWHAQQLDFLSRHRYFTKTARSLRDAGKQANIAKLRRLLEGS